MKKTSLPLCAALVMATLGSSHVLATTYTGNGNGGFGGVLGSGTLTITDNASTGLISFNLTSPNNFTNNTTIYLDTESGAGGIGSSTANLTDFTDEGRTAISGLGPYSGNTGETATAGSVRSLIDFATGFSPEYAITLDGQGNGNLFQLVNNSTLNYVAGANFTGGGTNDLSFSVTAAELGLTAGTGADFHFVATYANAGDTGGDYLSNETIGPVTSTPANPGDGGTIQFTGYDSYQLGAVPEPSSAGLLMASSVVCAGYLVRRRLNAGS